MVISKLSIIITLNYFEHEKIIKKLLENYKENVPKSVISYYASCLFVLMLMTLLFEVRL